MCASTFMLLLTRGIWNSLFFGFICSGRLERWICVFIRSFLHLFFQGNERIMTLHLIIHSRRLERLKCVFIRSFLDSFFQGNEKIISLHLFIHSRRLEWLKWVFICLSALHSYIKGLKHIASAYGLGMNHLIHFLYNFHTQSGVDVL